MKREPLRRKDTPLLQISAGSGLKWNLVTRPSWMHTRGERARLFYLAAYPKGNCTNCSSFNAIPFW
jgi:hypothetical protein